MARWAPWVVAAALAALPAAAPAAGRVVLLPFESAARRAAAREAVMPVVEAALRLRGWDVASGAEVEEFLRARRIRYLDSLAAAHVRELAAAFGADAIVTGSILAWDPGPRDPRVTLVERLVARDGAILWTDLASTSAATSGRAFGLGRLDRVDALARRAAFDLGVRLPAPGASQPPAVAETFPGAPRAFRSPGLVGQRLKICVLPLQNHSQDPAAPRVLDGVLQHLLSSRPDTSTVSPGDLRAAIAAARLQAPSVLSLEHLRALSDVVGTPLFLRGTILAYGGPDPSGAAAPLELYLALVDARSGEVVWSGLHRRSGADYEGLLRFGAIADDAALASRVVAELLDAFTRRRSTMEPER